MQIAVGVHEFFTIFYNLADLIMKELSSHQLVSFMKQGGLRSNGDLVHLQRRIMSAGVQAKAAGFSRAVIALIVIGAAVETIIRVMAEVWGDPGNWHIG
jgi:hypothetical protein